MGGLAVVNATGDHFHDDGQDHEAGPNDHQTLGGQMQHLFRLGLPMTVDNDVATAPIGRR